MIAEVESGTPAAKAGLKGGSHEASLNGIDITLGGDLIVAIAGEPVHSAEDVSRIVTERLLPGQVVAFDVLRGGTRRERSWSRSPSGRCARRVSLGSRGEEPTPRCRVERIS